MSIFEKKDTWNIFFVWFIKRIWSVKRFQTVTSFKSIFTLLHLINDIHCICESGVACAKFVLSYNSKLNSALYPQNDLNDNDDKLLFILSRIFKNSE